MKSTVIFVLAALLLVGCGSKPIQQPPQAVQTQQLEPSSTVNGSNGVHYSAFVAADQQVLMAARVPGYVVSLLQVRGIDGKLRAIGEGDHIERGARLVQLRSSEYQDKVHQAKSQLDAAEATAQKAQLDYARAQHLYASQSITKPDMDGAQAQYDATQAELRAARAFVSESQVALYDTALVAPFSGEIIKKTVELGSFLGPGQPALVIANTDKVKIVVGVPDTTVRSLKVGQPVSVAVDAFPNRTFEARISRIAAGADPKTRNFDVEVAIPNRDHLVKVGMIGSLQLATGETEKQPATLLVPISAITRAKNGKYGVFLLSSSSAGDVARLHEVEVGNVDGSQIQIISGLTPGDTIVTSGAALLTDGQRVEVVR